MFSIGVIIESFDVVIDIFHAGSFVSNDEDTRFACLFQNGFKRFGRERNDANRVDALGDQVFNKLSLERTVAFGWTGVECVNARFLCEFIDADFHALEPRNRGHLRNYGDRIITVGENGAIATNVNTRVNNTTSKLFFISLYTFLRLVKCT